MAKIRKSQQTHYPRNAAQHQGLCEMCPYGTGHVTQNPPRGTPCTPADKSPRDRRATKGTDCPGIAWGATRPKVGASPPTSPEQTLVTPAFEQAHVLGSSVTA